MSWIVRIEEWFCHNHWMINMTFSVNPQVSEYVVKHLFLNLKMCYNISIKLSFKLESDCFNIGDIISHLSLSILCAQIFWMHFNLNTI
jgi:hypothetical protein